MSTEGDNGGGCAFVGLCCVLGILIAIFINQMFVALNKRDYWIQDLQRRIAVLEQKK